MSHLWKSKLNSSLDPQVDLINRSIDVDSRLWKQDIAGSMAHVKMLIHTRLVGKENGEAILNALADIEAKIDLGQLKPTIEDEDIHSWIERELVLRLGISGSNVHIARSRNEQVLLDVKLYMIKFLEDTLTQFDECMSELEQLEKLSQDAIVPSYTHLRRAQPLFLFEYWEAHRIFWHQSREAFFALKKNLLEECPMGAGAIHGTTLPSDPEFEAKMLGFKRPPQNSLATISSRRFILDFLSIATHWFLDLSRLMEDLILFSTEEFQYISFAPGVTTGSSMMPQKKNPDLCELIRGKSSTVIGHYLGMMTLVKGLPMGYMKDLQEDKTHLFAVVDLLKLVLDVLPVLLKSINLHREVMEEACSDPQLLATDWMEALVLQGVPLREAHHRVADILKENPNSPELKQFNARKSCEKRYQGIQSAYKKSESSSK